MSVRDEVIREEGRVKHVYQDHLGFWTLGVGFLVDKRKGGEIPDAVIDFWLDYKLEEIRKHLDRVLPWWKTQPQRVQDGLVNMAFQLGVGGLLEFKNMLAALKAGDYPAAQAHARKSKWCEEDTPARAERVIAGFHA